MGFQRTELLCFACLPDGYSFAQRIAAASRAGFRELSLWLMSIDEAVGEDNLGYVIDTWHFARSGLDYAALAEVPADKLLFIQIGDAGRQPGDNIIAETLGHRIPPGEGVIDCPIGTEMFSNAVKAMPLEEASQYLYDTLQRPFS